MTNDKTLNLPPPRKLTYEPPRVKSEETFERLALACSKTPDDFPCTGDTFS